MKARAGAVNWLTVVFLVPTCLRGSHEKEIVYSGDALNTGARIQSLCGTYREDLLIS